ncbi:MAG: HD domain-containing protein [Patescibacteria group bacterium]
MSNLQNILKFVEFTNEFRRIERGVHLLHEKRGENDSEHCFQLAVVAWYIISSHKLDLDIQKVVMYALVHDLIEVYSGDTPVFNSTQEYFESKEEREANALEQIKLTFSESPDMWEKISQYEKRQDEESVFVYCLDKLLPYFVTYLDRGYSWRKNKMTLEDIIEKKSSKIAKSPLLKKYFDELNEIVRKNEKEYFG